MRFAMEGGAECRGGRLLWWGVLDELNALFDVALEAGNASVDQLLLGIGHTVQDVDRLLHAVGLYFVSLLAE